MAVTFFVLECRRIMKQDGPACRIFGSKRAVVQAERKVNGYGPDQQNKV